MLLAWGTWLRWTLARPGLRLRLGFALAFRLRAERSWLEAPGYAGDGQAWIKASPLRFAFELNALGLRIWPRWRWPCQGLRFASGRNARCDSPRACLLYTSPSPRDRQKSRMPSS